MRSRLGAFFSHTTKSFARFVHDKRSVWAWLTTRNRSNCWMFKYLARTFWKSDTNDSKWVHESFSKTGAYCLLTGCGRQEHGRDNTSPGTTKTREYPLQADLPTSLKHFAHLRAEAIASAFLCRFRLRQLLP